MERFDEGKEIEKSQRSRYICICRRVEGGRHSPGPIDRTIGTTTSNETSFGVVEVADPASYAREAPERWAAIRAVLRLSE